MKNLIYSALSFALLFLMQSCATVDYLSISVPEEGALNLTKITDDGDNIIGPAVERNALTNNLMWYAAPFISLSNDGKTLAYVAKNNDFMNLYLRSTLGGRSVVQKTFNKNVFDMCFSQDDKKIVFSASDGADMNIYMIKQDGGSAVQQLVSSNQNEMGAIYSNDYKRLFFTRQEGERFYIWSMDLENFMQTQYTEGLTPQLTKEPNQLLITRNSKDGNNRGEIWIVDIVKGTETCILSRPNVGFSSPELSPDGKTVVCVGSTPGNATKPSNLDIYTVSVDGSNIRQHTFHGGHDVSPRWSKDGAFIYFISQRGNPTGSYNIWKMSFDNNF